MDYHLENKILFNNEPEFKNLYSWSLQELSNDGETDDSNQVPWEWSLYFTASELRYNHTIKIESSDEPENITEEFEHISAVLHPGICRDGENLEDDTSYSMFGTNRRIKQFGLTIHKAIKGKENKEHCRLWGCVSYTAELDFREETTDDIIEIHLVLNPKRFNKLVEIIETKRADICQVKLSGVSGFYSEWSPSTSTSRIKVLANYEEQEIMLPDNCEVEPPRLGDVGEFDIIMTQRNILNPKQDLTAIDFEKKFEELPFYEEEEDKEENSNFEPDANALLITQLARNETILGKLRTPLWLIVIVLMLLFIKLAL